MVGEEHFIPFGPIDDIILKDEFTFEDVKTVHCVARTSTNICSHLIQRANREKLHYLTICIPAYNEELEEMIKTLVSLLENIEFMEKKAANFPEFTDIDGIIEEFKNTVPIIVPIFDGTKAISKSMRGWIEEKFPGLIDDLQPLPGGAKPDPDSVEVRIGCSRWWYLCDYEEKEKLAKEQKEQSSVGTGNVAVDKMIEGILKHYHRKRQDKINSTNEEPFFIPMDKVFRETEHEQFKKRISSSSLQKKHLIGLFASSHKELPKKSNHEERKDAMTDPFAISGMIDRPITPTGLPFGKPTTSPERFKEAYQTQNEENSHSLPIPFESNNHHEELSHFLGSRFPQSFRGADTTASTISNLSGDLDGVVNDIRNQSSISPSEEVSAVDDNSNRTIHIIKNRFGEEVGCDSDRIIQFYVCPIVKRSNHRKHNSHQWFFDAICDGLEDKTIYALLTDCGTSYAETCVARLMVELYRMPDLIGVTARQRVETPNRYFHPCLDAPYAWMQGEHKMGSDACWKCWLTFLLSPCPLQGIEFEGSVTISLAMFNLVEALPVMPGPCQLMHWQKMKEFQVVDEYFNLLFEGENEKIALPQLPPLLMPMKGGAISSDLPGMEEGTAKSKSKADYRPIVQLPEASKATMTFAEFLRTNMRLAEDRILTFVSIFSTGYGTKWVLGSTFYYQPEIQWNTLLTQRRRWTNGTFAGFLFSFFSQRAKARILGGMFDAHKPGKNVRAIYILWSLQVLILCYLFVSPAIFGAGSYKSLGLLAYNWPEAFSWAITPVINENIRVVEILAAFYLIVYASWMIGSFYAPRGKMAEGLCQALALYCCFMVLPMYISIWRTIALGGVNIIGILVIFNLFIPVVISLGEDMKSAMLYLLYLPWLLSLVMFFIVFFPAYSFARLWDTTWGNRATGKDSAVNDSMESYLKQQNFHLILIVISVNILLLWAFVQIFSLGYTAIVIFMFIFFSRLSFKLLVPQCIHLLFGR